MHAVVGGFTPDNTSFLVMNSEFHFVLAINVIVCTADVGNVLRTSVCTSPTVWRRKCYGLGLNLS